MTHSDLIVSVSLIWFEHTGGAAADGRRVIRRSLMSAAAGVLGSVPATYLDGGAHMTHDSLPLQPQEEAERRLASAKRGAPPGFSLPAKRQRNAYDLDEVWINLTSLRRQLAAALPPRVSCSVLMHIGRPKKC